MTTHITYTTAKRLKEFLGESAPQSITHEWWNESFGRKQIIHIKFLSGHENSWNIPAYQLHDLLSKPFCEAMANKRNLHNGHGFASTWRGVSRKVWFAYVNLEGGLPAVERALMEMMK